jgi:hypothetical protein
MPSGYELYVRHEVHLRIGALKSKTLESLSSDPFQKGDYQDRTPEGRDVQVKVIGAHALVYWADHPVREVKIVDFVQADV